MSACRSHFFAEKGFAITGIDIDLAKGETLSRGGSYILVIVTDHSKYDYARVVEQAQLVVDTRNATKGIVAANLVRC
jgi:UDP-N-acetyl-D-mannosaminuronate dehydrogenase